MKKRIILLRHAKTEPFDYTKDDFKRNLTDRGINDATSMSLAFREKEKTLDYIISSPANRAKQTSSIFAKTFNLESIHFEQDIYDSLQLPRFLKILEVIPNTVKTTLLVGHNPDIYELACNLSNKFISHIPTCCAITFSTSSTKWDELCSDSFTLETIDTPKSH